MVNDSHENWHAFYGIFAHFIQAGCGAFITNYILGFNEIISHNK